MKMTFCPLRHMSTLSFRQSTGPGGAEMRTTRDPAWPVEAGSGQRGRNPEKGPGRQPHSRTGSGTTRIRRHRRVRTYQPVTTTTPGFVKAPSCGSAKGALGTMTRRRPAGEGAAADRTPDPWLTPQLHEELSSTAEEGAGRTHDGLKSGRRPDWASPQR